MINSPHPKVHCLDASLRITGRLSARRFDVFLRDVESLFDVAISYDGISQNKSEINPKPEAFRFTLVLSSLAKVDELNECFTKHRVTDVDAGFMNSSEWQESSRERLQILKFGRLSVVPTHRMSEANDPYVVLDPGLGFGSGRHETTALCLDWLATHRVIGQCVIDAGCGSGILSIAAKKLGAAEVIAVDLDPQAIQATESNCHRNDVFVETRHDFSRLSTCDIVLANIEAKPLISLAPTLTGLVRRGGTLLLCGLLPGETNTVVGVYSEFRLIDRSNKNGWVLLEMMKL